MTDDDPISSKNDDAASDPENADASRSKILPYARPGKAVPLDSENDVDDPEALRQAELELEASPDGRFGTADLGSEDDDAAREKWTPVWQFSQTAEAHMAAAMLDEQGIPSVIDGGDGITNAMLGVPLQAHRLFVSESNAPRAAALLRERQALFVPLASQAAQKRDNGNSP